MRNNISLHISIVPNIRNQQACVGDEGSYILVHPSWCFIPAKYFSTLVLLASVGLQFVFSHFLANTPTQLLLHPFTHTHTRSPHWSWLTSNLLHVSCPADLYVHTHATRLCKTYLPEFRVAALCENNHGRLAASASAKDTLQSADDDKLFFPFKASADVIIQTLSQIYQRSNTKKNQKQHIPVKGIKAVGRCVECVYVQREWTDDVLVIWLRRREHCRLADVFSASPSCSLPGFGLRRLPVRNNLKGFLQ